MKIINVLIRMMVVLAVLLSVISVGVSAEESVPYEAYQAWHGQGKTYNVKQKAVFTPSEQVTGEKLGIGFLSQPRDLCVSSDQIYVLDSGNNRVVILNKDYTLSRIVNSFNYNGELLEFSDAEGIYATEDGTLYIADPELRRVIVSDGEGTVKTVLTCPDSPIIPEGLDFMARKITVDRDGYLFVLCKGVYYGAMVFDQNYQFCGFFGANRTSQTVLGAVKEFITGLFQTDAKLEYSYRTLPYTFENLFEHNGFIYTTTISSDTDVGQIRKLSYSSTNVLNSDDGSADMFAFGNGKPVTLADRTTVKETFSAIAVDEYGLIYALDSTYGRVLVYNNNCELITAFGGGLGLGTQLGVFQSATEIDINGTDVLVLDSVQNAITVFNITDYGKILYQAMTLADKGDYAEAFPLWEKVHALDGYNQKAYIGMANYYISEHEYTKAMSYAKQGFDRDIYERAFEEVRRTFLADNFGWIVLVAVVVVAGLVFFILWRRKHKKEEKDTDLRLVLSSLIHPITVFTAIKRMNRQNPRRQTRIAMIAVMLMLLLFVAKTLETTWGGFMYVSYDPNTYNSLLVLLSTVGVAALWCIVNWALCTLFEGKGNFREIVIVTGFSLLPLICYSVFYIVATHVLVFSESAAIGTLNVVAWVLTILFLLIGMSIIHEYSFFRSLGMSVVTLLGMFLAAFVLLLVLTLFQDVVDFVKVLYFEAVYRK